jgi:hypothetical protein
MVLYVSTNKNNLLIRVGNMPAIKKMVITIYDTQGRAVSSRVEKYEDITLDISSLASGTYLVKVQSQDGSEQSVNRFIK